MKSPHLALGALALTSVAVTVVGLVATHDTSSPKARPTVVSAARARQDASPPPSPTPTPSPPPTASASPSPPPPPPDPNPHLGTQGPDVLALQQRLSALAYMVGAADGRFGTGTRAGVIAFQKVEGLRLSGEADPPTLARLQTASKPQPAYTTPADHLEIDIARQVVFVVRGGAVSAVLPASTGSNRMFTSQGWTRRAITPNGVFNVYWKVPGWHEAPLGNLYKPSFFNGGIAFHGYYDVPSYPASHGCIRLPMDFADWFYDSAAPMGETVYVYGGPSGPNPAPALESSSATNAPPATGPSPSPAPSPTPAPTPSPTPTPAPPPLLNLFPTPTPTPSPTPTPPSVPPPSATPSASP